MTPNELKAAVAQAAIDHVLPRMAAGDALGVGTGSTANFFIDLLVGYKDKFRGAVASSTATAERLRKLGIEILDLNDVTELKFYVDGADESTPQLELIKGGGAALTREKIVAAVSQTFVCIADESKWVPRLGNFPLPVEVVPMAREFVRRELVRLGGEPRWRKGVVTDNGGEILDVYNLLISAPAEMESRINNIPGVITNGLFAIRRADVLLLGRTEGVVTVSPTPA